MNRILTSAALALSLLASSAVALADGGKGGHEHGDKAAFEKQFPMPAAQFQQKATERAQKAQQRLEKHLTEKQVPADKASEIRAKFAAHQARVQAKVTEVVADGTVTLDEAKAVRAVAHEGRPQHKGGHGKTAHKGQKLAASGSLRPSSRPLLMAMLSERPDDPTAPSLGRRSGRCRVTHEAGLLPALEG